MTATQTPAEVRTQIRDAVATVEFSNPARRNALSAALMADLARTLGALGDDPSVRVVVLRGAGTQAFASGADIGEFRRPAHGATGPEEGAFSIVDAAASRLFAQLSALPMPIIARIHGYCLGAGMALALGADLRFADTESVLGIPAARLGVGYPLDQTAALVETVGPAAAGDMLFTGRRLTAREALAIRLVDRVVEPHDLGPVVDEVAAMIAANAPLSVRASKTSIRAVRGQGTGQDNQSAARGLATEAIARCPSSRDLREGALAFLEKRQPRFTGE
ncbi:hypothetical protein CcI49_11450 [Frankia sp. CcI49]|uniref:enoyl-CoA hydratase-related protein n=1 Tax=Frankia sp. CcI49 TaxID=1745382 RepID=UPI000977C4A8|nr:enoyl-CoA hydratase-related protein [Frankia sp. CcI49]ONH60441.1 hypothetical protein CcI49_11450 [Frankia sp. CcI49]